MLRLSSTCQNGVRRMRAAVWTAWRALLATVVLAACAVGVAARADVEFLDSREAFLARSAPTISIDFEDEEGSGDESFAGGYERDGVRIYTSESYLVLRHGSGIYPNNYLYGPSSLGEFMHVELPPGTSAFGANVTTFYTRNHGTVGVTLASGESRVIEVNGLWDGVGANPTSSFLGIVSSEPLTWIRLEALSNDDTRGFDYDAVVVDNLLVEIGGDGRSMCEVERDSCLEELEQCSDAAPPDADGDGEADATDRCPDTTPGEPVDDGGCSLGQFCAGFESGGLRGLFGCALADWRNDEPFGARDCRVARRPHPNRYACLPR